MSIKTFRAKSLQEALHLVRNDLGPNATVLHTREVNRGLVGRFFRGREFEISASASVKVPSRLPERMQALEVESDESHNPITSLGIDYRSKYRDDFKNQVHNQLEQLTTLVESLRGQGTQTRREEMPELFFELFTRIIECDVDEEIAREYIERLRRESGNQALQDSELAMANIASMMADEIRIAGPIQTPPGSHRIVALVGPTGVGKTTTIAKLAANYRLREKKRVGLITVDTYRIAAVEQLRTYAEIIDLPMEVVATPREMREAIARFADLDLVLLDTAGRSPRDEVKLQELKTMVHEAKADEVHLVLSSTAGAKNLEATAMRFKEVGTTAIILTKLDEASTLGSLVGLCRACPLPLSYLTDGQNVPDDIQIADRRNLTQMILGGAV